ncbi:MAG: tetratricopeptide repeat protein, partial [Candidatus Omnitrophica bacterium]|nr:tetratricopeptide repeat protein [Candidatus Omnitrophota bacterium]
MKKIISFLILCNLFLFSPVAIADSVKQIFEQAMTEFSQGNYKKAIPLYEKALDMYPELAPAYNYLALAQKETGVSPSQVIATLQKAIEVNPNYATAYDNLCKVYYGVNDFDNAEKSCMRAVEIDPEAYSSKLALAWINLLGQSEPKEAITYFEDVVASTESEGGPQTQFGLGLAYFMVGEKFKTFEMITKLKMSGNEQMASQLEDMVRSNNYVPKAAEGLPLLNTPAQK